MKIGTAPIPKKKTGVVDSSHFLPFHNFNPVDYEKLIYIIEF